MPARHFNSKRLRLFLQTHDLLPICAQITAAQWATPPAGISLYHSVVDVAEADSRKRRGLENAPTSSRRNSADIGRLYR